jgi:hypothetical protein
VESPLISKKKRDTITVSASNMSKIRINNQDYFVPNQKQKVSIFKLLQNKPKTILYKIFERGTMLIPAYERGTDRPITSPTLAMVGERGPEQIVPHHSGHRMSSMANNRRSSPTPNTSAIDINRSPPTPIVMNASNNSAMFNLRSISFPIFDGEL